MVDIEQLDIKDKEKARQLIEKHYEFTESPRAHLILDQWTQISEKFVKVFPHDYKRVLGLSSNKHKKKKISIIEDAEKTVSNG